jgi:Pyruvate/2-oxoacid:ferredoxin oxidoreductase delta subunit
MKVKRKIIEIDQSLCNGCGACVTACAEGAIALVSGKARVVSDTYCDGLGACINECPQHALRIIEREADQFDKEAVDARQAPQKTQAPSCPSAQMRRMAGRSQCETFRKQANGAAPSLLTNWPVQIRLVAPQAPFLKGADLLVASDCTPFAFADFHSTFLDNRVLLTGCPKFDDKDFYVERFAEIFAQAGIRSVTVVVMEVPCCQAMPMIIEAGMQAAGTTLPLETVVIGISGDIVRRIKKAA